MVMFADLYRIILMFCIFVLYLISRNKIKCGEMHIFYFDIHLSLYKPLGPGFL